MKTKASLALIGVALFAIAPPVAAHHSYAMYDSTKTVTVTGVTVSFRPQSAHAELRMYLLGPDGKLLKRDGKNVEYGIEMAAAAAVAQEGVTTAAFPVGTIFSVRVNPMRTGEDFGARVSTIAKCPWKTTPKDGQTCAQVPGVQYVGGKSF
jgi:hypothetical protein